MPAAKNDLLDIRQFIAIQRQERYKAVVLHSLPEKDSERRAFASRLAELEDGVYLDVLAQVAGNRELSETIDLLDVAYLRQIALEAAINSTGLVIVDAFDFLLPVWGNDLSGLQQMITTLSRTDTPSVILFAMQTHPSLEKWPLHNGYGQSRILPLASVQELP